MRITSDTIIFKSKPEHWHKEHKGDKPNTVRYIDCIEWEAYKKADVKFISIVNTETGDTFHRKIKDLTCAMVNKQPVFIFSWGHSNFVQKDSITCLKKDVRTIRDVNNILL